MFPLTVKVPELTAICPKEFVPTPARVSVAPPVPVRSPDSVVVPVDVRVELLVTENALEREVTPDTLKVPPAKITVLLLILLLDEIESVPALTEVVPIYVFVPDSIWVPDPLLIKEETIDG
jgi:hypothetical protein